MSAIEEDVVQLSAAIDAVDSEVPLQDEFEELEMFSDDVEEPKLTVYYQEENMDAWLRFESWLAVDLEGVR